MSSDCKSDSGKLSECDQALVGETFESFECGNYEKTAASLEKLCKEHGADRQVVLNKVVASFCRGLFEHSDTVTKKREWRAQSLANLTKEFATSFAPQNGKADFEGLVLTNAATLLTLQQNYTKAMLLLKPLIDHLHDQRIKNTLDNHLDESIDGVSQAPPQPSAISVIQDVTFCEAILLYAQCLIVTRGQSALPEIASCLRKLPGNSSSQQLHMIPSESQTSQSAATPSASQAFAHSRNLLLADLTRRRERFRLMKICATLLAGEDVDASLSGGLSALQMSIIQPWVCYAKRNPNGVAMCAASLLSHPENSTYPIREINGVVLNGLAEWQKQKFANAAFIFRKAIAASVPLVPKELISMYTPPQLLYNFATSLLLSGDTDAVLSLLSDQADALRGCPKFWLRLGEASLVQFQRKLLTTHPSPFNKYASHVSVGSGRDRQVFVIPVKCNQARFQHAGNVAQPQPHVIYAGGPSAASAAMAAQQQPKSPRINSSAPVHEISVREHLCNAVAYLKIALHLVERKSSTVDQTFHSDLLSHVRVQLAFACLHSDDPCLALHLCRSVMTSFDDLPSEMISKNPMRLHHAYLAANYAADALVGLNRANEAHTMLQPLTKIVTAMDHESAKPHPNACPTGIQVVPEGKANHVSLYNMAVALSSRPNALETAAKDQAITLLQNVHVSGSPAASFQLHHHVQALFAYLTNGTSYGPKAHPTHPNKQQIISNC